jgi:hypothetical protein
MAYVETGLLIIPQPDPNLGIFIRFGQDILFSEIFNGVPQLYAGSSFLVEEVFEAKFEIYEPSLIDFDLRWNPTKQYIGTWTLSDTLPADGLSSEDTGFIVYESMKLKRYSLYTVQANADVPIATNEESAIDNCNFFLVTALVPTPPIPVGAGILSNNSSVFKSRETLRKVPLLDRVFLPKMRYIGLYVNTGAGIVSSKYTARVINGISVDLPPFAFDVCNIVPAQNCEQLFNTFLIQNQGFATQAQALAEWNATCPTANLGVGGASSSTWVCPIDPTDIRTYWRVECVTV